MKKQFLSHESLRECCDHIRQLCEVIKVTEDNGYTPADLSRDQWAELSGIPTLELNRIIKVGRQSESRLFRAYRGLIIHIAKSYRYKAEINDLIQEGFLGLRKAATRFDYQKGYEFSTYAFWWIRNAIQVSLENNSASEDPVLNPSLDSMSSWEADRITIKSSPLEQAHQIRIPEFTELQERIKALPDYEQELIRVRYGINCDRLTLKEIGLRHNVSYETARRHINRAINKLNSLYNLQKCA